MLTTEEIEGFKRLGSGHVCDAMEYLGIRRAVIHGFRFIGPEGGNLVGTAVTVRQAPKNADSKPTESKVRHGSVVTTIAKPGDVVVVDNGGRLDVGTWGENHCLRARDRGLAGALVDGCTRDGAAIKRMGFPVFCRGVSPVKSLWDLETVAVNEPVTIGGTQVRPGDLIFGDEDGVLVFPFDARAAVLARAKEIWEGEDVRRG
jgi:regulator of RNase E activity RraA